MNEQPPQTDSKDAAATNHLVARHVSIGWHSLLLFLLLGLGLETLHGFKLDFYLSVDNETRRLMGRLAHAHGAFLALVHLAFAVTVAHAPRWNDGTRRRASRCLTISALLIPAGFFSGGIVVHGGDPNISILMVPIGAVFLATAVAFTARRAALAIRQ